MSAMDDVPTLEVRWDDECARYVITGEDGSVGGASWSATGVETLSYVHHDHGPWKRSTKEAEEPH